MKTLALQKKIKMKSQYLHGEKCLINMEAGCLFHSTLQRGPQKLRHKNERSRVYMCHRCTKDPVRGYQLLAMPFSLW
jgi:hypothetical protein